MQDILHVLAPDGTILFISPSITDLCGFKPEEMVGKSITEFMELSDVNHFEEELKKSIMTERSMTTYYRLRKVGAAKNNGSLSSSFGPQTGSRSGLANLKEDDSDDSGGRHGSNQNDTALSSNAAAEAIAAINLQSESLLLEITGTPYYTTTNDGGKTKRGDHRRKDRNNQDGDYRMAEDLDSESYDGVVGGKESGSSSSSGNNSDNMHKSRNHNSSGTGTRRTHTTVKTCKCFFAMARPYPSRNNATLDTFLELKIENEKLRMKLADIYREIEGDDGLSKNRSSNSNSTADQGTSQDYSGMGTTHADDGSDFQLKNAHNQPPNPYFGADPMAIDTLSGNRDRQISGYPSRMAGSQHSTSNNIYNNNNTRNQQNAGFASSRQGEQSQSGYQQQQQHGDGRTNDSHMQGANVSGLRGGPIDSGDGLISSAGLIPSTSNTYGALGIGISAAARAAVGASNQNDDTSSTGQNAHSHSSAGFAATAAAAAAEDKKKKMKKQRTDEGEFVCRDCGTVDSPEWRRGPLGPKTLCNACGLRWAKKNKQQQRGSLGGNESFLATK